MQEHGTVSEKRSIGWNGFKNVTFTQRFPHSFNPSQTPDEIYKNNWFTVYVFHHKRVLGFDATKLLVKRNDKDLAMEPTKLNRMKNDLFGPQYKMIQYFPPKTESIGDTELCWLWVLQ